MVPVCLVTGFLGAGKTTLLKRLVAENRGRKWIYLVNEFSALDVDGAMVAEDNPDVVSIPGGSIFCKCLVGEFIAQMGRIRDGHPDAEGVVIEASGMADPRVMAAMLRETRLDAHFVLAQVVSIVEPRSFLRLIHTLPNIIHQVEASGLVLLNKCDLYAEEQLAATEQAVRRINPGVRLIRCAKGAADFALFGGEPLPDGLRGEYALCRDPRYETFTTAHGEPVDPAALERLVREHEEAVYRVKGCIGTADGPIHFDYSKAGFSVRAAQPRTPRGLAWICRGGEAAVIRERARRL
jgi:G3E family GTPase